MSDSGNVLKVTDTFETKLDNIGRIILALIYLTITGGFSLLLQQQINNPATISRSNLILSNALVFIGTYLYFTLVFFYKDITRSIMYGLLFIVLLVILTMVFTLLPKSKNSWTLVRTANDQFIVPKKTTKRETAEELIVLSIVLFIPIFVFTILLINSYYSSDSKSLFDLSYLRNIFSTIRRKI